MKKIMLIIFAIQFSFIGKAQNLTKEQTLEYLKGILTEKINYEVTPGKWRDVEDIVDEVTITYDMLEIKLHYKWNSSVINSIKFPISGNLYFNEDSFLINGNFPERKIMQIRDKSIAERALKAFNYLKKFIVNDPFAN